ncbi:hypothetical protein BBF96_06075 [Anoxybacter fermentans]|uniref:Transposase n=1 Tax=Anoxybacter fermentans TaxID=1323375 RepID=A0A3S9SXH8_9FIRM|nr:hypothetical protein BBF96_06075 [Anoxybacter fermentans]
MIKLIQILLLYIQIQQKIIVFLISSLPGKHITRKAHDKLIDKHYRKLQVDQMPIIEIPEKLNFNQLLIDYQNSHGKPLKPIKRHKNKKVKIPSNLGNLICPRCGAPHQYLYSPVIGLEIKYENDIIMIERVLFMKRKKYSDELKQQIIEECRLIGNIALVARRHEISRQTVYSWIKSSRQKGSTESLPRDEKKQYLEVLKKLE